MDQDEGDDAQEQEILWDVTDESSDDEFDIPLMTHCQQEKYMTNESILDPETGLLNNSSKTHWNTSVGYPGDITFNKNHPDLLAELISSSSKQKETTDSDEIPNKKWKQHDKDAQIYYYIHKKFRNNSKIEEAKYTISENESSMEIALLSQSEDVVNLQLSFMNNSTETRKSR